MILLRPALSWATSLSLFIVTLFAAPQAFAIPYFNKSNDQSAPAVLKADEVSGDRNTNTLVATGNVEVTKGLSVVYADEVNYEKNGGIVRAIGNVRVRNIEVGNIRATKAEIKDDFSSGKFYDSKLFFNDGSYLAAPKITRKTPLITVLTDPVYSICPNPEISANNSIAGKKRDFVSITSTETTIDREENVMRSKGGMIRFYDVPFFYTPYLSVALPSKKRKSGFLNPSYAKSSNLGFGIKIPYYFDIAPNIDLTTTPLIGVSNNQILISNELRHYASYGDYSVNLEAANNKITSNTNSTVVARTSKKYRWNLNSKGKFDFTKNSGLDFVTNFVSDRNYLRDYHFNFLNYTVSKVNLDYINARNYHAVKLIKIQELESLANQKAEPTIIPIDSHIETKPLSYKEKFSLTSNLTTITREDGLQYRRATATPEFSIPFNLQGNLFNLIAKVQTDLYSLENNFQSTAATTNYNSVEANYKPEISLGWRMPLIKKSKTKTIMIEPMVNLVSSSYKKNFNGLGLPNEDSNNTELTVSNLLISDRIAGFDRNESGSRLSYGVKTSLFNQYGEFGLTLGQGYKKGGNQDIIIRGFNDNNKSNFVGQAMYKATKYFYLAYSFQLNESSYRNDVNQLTTTIDFQRFGFTTDYLLIRQTIQNPSERKQLSLSAKIKMSERWSASLTNNQDLVIGRTLSRSLTLMRDGCCTVFGFSVMETNPSSLSKPQKSFNLSLLFKNL
jgi:LPS-assembly protein